MRTAFASLLTILQSPRVGKVLRHLTIVGLSSLFAQGARAQSDPYLMALQVANTHYAPATVTVEFLYCGYINISTATINAPAGETNTHVADSNLCEEEYPYAKRIYRQITLNSGGNSVSAVVDDVWSNEYEDDEYYYYDLILVTPPAAQRIVKNSSGSSVFKLNNRATSSKTVSLSSSCSGGITCGSLSSSSATIAAGDSTTITANFTTPNSTGSGNVTLTATITGATSSGVNQVTSTTTVPPTITALTTDATHFTSTSQTLSFRVCLSVSGGMSDYEVSWNGYTFNTNGTFNSGDTTGCPSGWYAKVVNAYVTLNPGANTIAVYAYDAQYTYTIYNGTYYYDAPSAPTLAGPSAVTIDQGVPKTVVYTVTNPDARAISYQVTSSCSGMTCGNIMPWSFNLAAGASQDVTMDFLNYSSSSTSMTMSVTGQTGGTTATKSTSISMRTPGKRWMIAGSPNSIKAGPDGWASARFNLTDTTSYGPTIMPVRVRLSQCPRGGVATAYCFFEGTTATSNIVLGTTRSFNVQVLSPTTVGTTARLWVAYDYGTWTSTGYTSWTTADSAYVDVVTTPLFAVAVSPHDSTVSKRQPGTTQSETFTITNTGVLGSFGTGARYVLTPSCGSFTSCVVSSDTLTMNPNASQTVTVSYATPTSVPTTGNIKLRADVVGTSYTAKDSGTKHITVNETASPTIAISPLQNDIISTRAFTAILVACDSDGVVSSPIARFNGTLLAGAASSTTSPGCATAQRVTYPLFARSGRDTIRASVTDGYHDTVTVTRAFTYEPASEVKPLVTADLADALIAASAARADTFRVRNPGPISASYALTANCTALGVSCTVSPSSASIEPGDYARAVISYTAPSSGSAKAVWLKATFTGPSGATSVDSAQTLVSIGTGALPTIALTPSDGSTTTSSTTTISATWCDSDDGLSLHQIWLNGVQLSDTYSSSTHAGCTAYGTSSNTGIPLVVGPNQITAIAKDAAGHRVSSTAMVTFTPTLSAFIPTVSPRNTTIYAVRGQQQIQNFIVTNTSSYAATYRYAVTCGSPVTNCALSKAEAAVAAGGVDTLQLWYGEPNSFGTSATASIVINGTPWGTSSFVDTARVTLATRTIAQAYQPEVTPSSATYLPIRGYVFGPIVTVKNIGAETAHYTYTKISTGIINSFANDYTVDSYGVPVEHELGTLAPGASTWINLNAITPGKDSTSYLHLRVHAKSGTDSTAATGEYSLTGRDYDPYIAIVKPIPDVYDPSYATTHSFAYSLVSHETGYDTITVNISCARFVTSCKDSVANSASFKFAPGGDTVTRRIVYTPNTSYVSGSVQITATLRNSTKTDTANVTVRTYGNVRAFTLTPAALTIHPPGGKSLAQSFVITNTGDGDDVSDSYTYTYACAGYVSSCSVTHAPTSADTVAQYGKDSIVMAYTSPSTLGNSGTITVIATSVRNTALKDTAVFTVTSTAASLVAVQTANVSAGPQLERSACLAIAAGSAASYECGDLRLVHSLPATTTMGKARAPTLTYLSRHAKPLVLIAADVTMQYGFQATSGIQATLSVTKSGTTTTDTTRTYTWSSPTGNPIRRIVVPVNEESLNDSTGAYHYTLEVKPVGETGTGAAASDTGTFVVVDRRASPFGAGWWLEGLEQLFFRTPASTQRLWVAGDGSTRLYSRQTDTTMFLAGPLNRPDTLTYNYTTGIYARHLPNRGSVEFNGSGQHVRTIGAMGDTTLFSYTGSRLDSISLPVPSGSVRPSYVFTYANDANSIARLASVIAPYAVNVGDRITTIAAQNTGDVESIRYRSGDTATAPVSFAYTPGISQSSSSVRRLTSRFDRLARETVFAFDSAGGLSTSRIRMQVSSDDIVNTFCPIETISLSSCNYGPVPVANATAWWDGPRDVADITTFYINRFGAPDTVINALGQKTRVERSTTWPLLATAVTSPNGHKVATFYNATRALPDSTVDYSPYGVPDSNAVTKYVWHSKWTHPIEIDGPTGERSYFRYDTAYALRLAEHAGNNDSTEYYYTNRRLSSMRPAGNTTSYKALISYESVLGNLLNETSPAGAVTKYHADRIGRVDSVYSPIDGTNWRIQHSSFDALGRVVATTDFGPRHALGVSGADSAYAPAMTAIDSTFYDKEGNALRNKRFSVTPDSTSHELTHWWTYDNANRKVSTLDALGAVDSTFYDPASNVTRVSTRRRQSVTSTYDLLNRLDTKVVDSVSYAPSSWAISYRTAYFPHFNSNGFIYDYDQTTPTAPTLLGLPREVSTFTYDITGGIETATNHDAKTTRHYYPNGALKGETQQIAVINDSATVNGDRYASHVYRLGYAYDLSGRRVSRTDTIPNCSPNCQQTYHYATLTGALDQMTDGGATFKFSYDGAGRFVADTTLGGGKTISQVRDYDVDGRLGSRALKVGTETVYNDALTYDQAGRVTHANSTSDRGVGEDTYQGYTGLGGLAAMKHTLLGTQLVDEYKLDAFGSTRRHTRIYDDGGRDTLSSVFDGERLAAVNGTAGGSAGTSPSLVPTIDTTAHFYDLAGNETQSESLVAKYVSGAGAGFYATVAGRSFTWSAYSAENKLKVVQRSYWEDSVHLRTTFTEFRYDALGRRVLSRTRYDLHCNPENSTVTGRCYPSVERTAWDGDQMLAEFRNIGYAGLIDTTRIEYCSPDRDQISKLGVSCVAPGELPPASAWVQSYQEYEYMQYNPWGGTIRYTHGGGIDEPLAVWRSELGMGLVPHRSWRGVYKSGTYLGSDPSPGVAWIGRNQDGYRHSDSRAVSKVQQNYWMGSIIDGAANATGLTYQRNRYYDPSSGRFTQEDPIGLAGGMNLYGFGGGDPVNFSDPFGLWPFSTHNNIINSALGDIGFGDRTLIKLGSVLHDITSQSEAQSYTHAMAEQGQNQRVQMEATAEFVEDASRAARGLQLTGHHMLAMIELGIAMHPVMDKTSPSHSDASGKPRVWHPSDGPAHRKAESGSPTPAQQQQMTSDMREMYRQTTAKP